MAALAFGEQSGDIKPRDPGGRIGHRRARRGVRDDLPRGPRRADRQADARPRGVDGRMTTCPTAHRAMYSYLASVMEPWDGPAALAMTDGRWAVAGMDRNALRPLRFTLHRRQPARSSAPRPAWSLLSRSDASSQEGPPRARPDDRRRSRRRHGLRRSSRSRTDRRRAPLCVAREGLPRADRPAQRPASRALPALGRAPN